MTKLTLRQLGAKFAADPRAARKAFLIASQVRKGPVRALRVQKQKFVPIERDATPSVRIRAEMKKGSRAPPFWMLSVANDDAASLVRRAA